MARRKVVSGRIRSGTTTLEVTFALPAEGVPIWEPRPTPPDKPGRRFQKPVVDHDLTRKQEIEGRDIE